MDRNETNLLRKARIQELIKQIKNESRMKFDIEKLPIDVILLLKDKIETTDFINLIAAYDKVGRDYYNYLPPTNTEKWGFFIIQLMFKEVKRFMKQEEDPKKKRKPQVVRKYSLYTIVDKIKFFKTITIYVNVKKCGCRIYSGSGSDNDGSDNDDNDNDSVKSRILEKYDSITIDYDTDSDDTDTGFYDDSDDESSVSEKTNIDIRVPEHEFWDIGKYTEQNIIGNDYKLGVLEFSTYTIDPYTGGAVPDPKIYTDFQHFMHMFTQKKQVSYYFYNRYHSLRKLKSLLGLHYKGKEINAHVFEVMQKHMFSNKEQYAFTNGNYISYYAENDENIWETTHEKLLDCKHISLQTEYNIDFIQFLVQLRSLEKHTQNLEKLWDFRIYLYKFIVNTDLSDHERNCAQEYFLYFLFNGTSIEDIMYTINKWQMKSWSQPSIAAAKPPQIPEIKDDNIISLAAVHNKDDHHINKLDLLFYPSYGGIMIYEWKKIGMISKVYNRDNIVKNVQIVSDDIIQKSFEDWNKSLLLNTETTHEENKTLHTGVFYLPKIIHMPKKINETSGGSKYMHLLNKYTKKLR